MKNALLTYNLPTTRTSGQDAPVTEIRHVEISLSADLGVNFGVLSNVTPFLPDGVTPLRELFVPDLEIGDWVFRFVVVGNDDTRSADLDFPVLVPDDTPFNTVLNVAVTLS